MKRTQLSLAIASIFLTTNPLYGEGGDPPAVDLTNPDVLKAINDAAEKLTAQNAAGLKAKNDELLGKMKELQLKSKDFEGLDAVKLKAMMAALNQSEEAQLMADGKLDEVIQKRLDRVTAGYQDKFKDLESQLNESRQNESKYKINLDRNTIRQTIEKVALESGALPNAIDDIVRRASEVFSVDSTGKVAAVDKDGFLLKQDGLEITPTRFVDGLKKTSSYYWAASAGGNFKGGSSFSIDGKTDKGAAAAAEIVGSGRFDLEAYRAARGTDKKK